MKTRIACLIALAALAASPALAKKYNAAPDFSKAAQAKAASAAAVPTPVTAEVSVDASKVIRKLTRELFGQNVNVYEGSGDGADPAYNAAVTSMGTGLMRFPGGGYGEFTDWENYKSGKLSWLPIDMDKGIAFAKATNCQLQVIVNCAGEWGDQKHTLEEAVAKARKWVHYLNIKPAACPATWWEIGNENFGMKGGEYGERFTAFFKAMKAEDPKIKIGLQVQYDKADWSAEVLKAVKKGGVRPDFFIVHSYPIWFPKPGRLAADAPSWDTKLYSSNPFEDARILDLAVSFPLEFQDKLDKLVADNFDPKAVGKIPYWMTEYRSVLEYKYDEFVDTLFCSQFLLQLAQNGWQGANIWALKNGFSKETGCDFGLLRTGVNADFPDDNPKDSPRPTYYIFPFLSRVFGRDMVKCNYPDYAPLDSEGNKVRAWASKDAEGNLTVFLVNNHPEIPADVEVKVAGFAWGTEGKTWTLEPAGRTLEGADTPVLQRRDITVNGVLRPDPTTLPGEGKPLTVGSRFKVLVPPASIVLVKVPKGTGAILAPSAEDEAKPALPVQKTASSVKAPEVKLAAGQVLLQDFSVDDQGVYSPWKDDKGSSLAYSLEDVKPDGKPGEKMITIKYNQVAGGWCGMFCRAGGDWNGLTIGKPKSVEIRIYSENPVAFGLSLADDAKVEVKVEVPPTKGGKQWETVTVPVGDVPTAFAGSVKGFNLYMMSPGEGTFSIDRIIVNK